MRKGFEAYFAVLLELFWDKRRILEVYVNVVELGHGIYGVEAAAQAYYKKSAKDLTVEEAARLAAILPSPLHRTPQRPGGADLRASARRCVISRRRSTTAARSDPTRTSPDAGEPAPHLRWLNAVAGTISNSLLPAAASRAAASPCSCARSR